ncbi:RNA ligase/cyclic nucleotide phosphodiesterase [Nemania serpens]|nr:RNA ligase/cyclic nucleotide phosphodiesterase [Nemania serpens]
MVLSHSDDQTTWCQAANPLSHPQYFSPNLALVNIASRVAATILCHPSLVMSSALLEAGRVSDPVPVSDECLSKFNGDGTAKLYPGNTVLCHLRAGIPSHLAFSERLVAFLAGVFSDQPAKFHATLPRESWHVTLLDLTVYNPETMGDCDPRGTRDFDMSRFRQGFLDMERELQTYLPIRLNVDLGEDRLPVNGKTLQIPLTANDDDGMHKLSLLRKALADKLGISLKDRYKVHLTTHYQVGVMSEDNFSVLRQNWASELRNLAETVGALEINSIELCEFNDMTSFQPVAWVYHDVDGIHRNV